MDVSRGKYNLGSGNSERRNKNMILFICGILLGGLIGVGMMCLIYIGRDD